MKESVKALSLIFSILILSSCTPHGYDDGYEVGFEAGHAAGYTDGYNEGLSATVLPNSQAELNESYEHGYSSGLDAGYSAGYDDGFSDGISETGYTEDEYQRYAQDRVDAIIKELFAGQINPYTGNPVNSEEDYREYISEYRRRNSN